MPTYKVKPEQNYNGALATQAPERKKKTYPSVSIPVSKEIIDALEVGKSVEVTLKGKVCGLESRQSSDPTPWGNRDEMRIELRTVEAYPAEGGDDEPEEKEPDMKDAIDEGLGYNRKK